MNEETSDNEIEDWKKFLDGIDFNGPPSQEPRKKTPNFPRDPQGQWLLDREVEKTKKWLQKNYPRKPKEPRQLKEDPDSGTFI